MDINHLKNYDPSSLIDYFDKVKEKIKLPSGEEISAKPEDIKFELYKRTKKVIKEALELKEEFVIYLQLKMNSNPYDEQPFSWRLINIIGEESKTYLKYFNEMWPLFIRQDPVVFKAIKDIGETEESIKGLKIFFETCLDIVEKDKKKYNSGGWR